MFLGYPSASFIYSFRVRTHLVTMVSHERLEQSRWNLQGIFTIIIIIMERKELGGLMSKDCKDILH